MTLNKCFINVSGSQSMWAEWSGNNFPSTLQAL